MFVYHDEVNELPIYEVEQQLISELTATRRLVLRAPTGSGKSTQVPQMLLKHGLLDRGQLITLQPRRLAARMLAARVARELNVPLGREVGYQVRFENYSRSETRIKFETEGILLRHLIENPRLEGIQALVFDEFHERHLYGDITLARALDIQEAVRPDLYLIVMSATLDTGALQKYLQPCSVVTTSGRTHPVHLNYLQRRSGPAAPPVWELAAQAFSKHVKACGEDGHVLVFMPGGYEISRTIEAIRSTPESKGRAVLPLYGELPAADQDAAVEPSSKPKVVVATNVAETSITIEGVRLVIDSGLARIASYDPNRGINTLMIERISRASAEQRAGRAGRTGPGECVRLWSEAEHAERRAQDLPEVQRLDLSEIVLTLKAAGVGDLRKFRWMEPPPEAALSHAHELLSDLGALTGSQPDAVITDLGIRMLSFPVHPRYSRMLLAAQEYGCVYEACLVAALTQGRDLFVRRTNRDKMSRRKEVVAEETLSDFRALIAAWEFAAENQFKVETLRAAGIHAATARQVSMLHSQFLRIAENQGLHTRQGNPPEDALRKCILIAFSDRVARRVTDGAFRCELVHGRRGSLERESVVRDSALIVASEIREIGARGGEASTVLSLATAIEPAWLLELFPKDLRSEVRLELDSATRRVEATEALCFRGLAIETRRMDPPADAAAQILAEEVVAGRMKLTHWDHALDQWILRLNLLAAWRPDLRLPPIQDEDRRAIIEQICLGARSYKEIKDREVKTTVTSWLSPSQRHLVDKLAPERVTLPNGRTPKVTYEASSPPFIALRIQELFDVRETPTIAEGRVQLSVHILAPSMRPVQVTRDLANFWREHYPGIKSELKRRYPKHEWR